jgi:hypothetical protein
MVSVDAAPGASLAGKALNGLWQLFGSQPRDEPSLMQKHGLTVLSDERFGAFHTIRRTVAVLLPADWRGVARTCGSEQKEAA